MIQLIESLPFNLETELESLKRDWTRFQDGLVSFNEIPDAIRGIFNCEAELINQKNEYESENEEVQVDVNKFIPSGNGKLILTANKLFWIKSSAPFSGWSIDYKNVLLHAISKPEEARPYVYLQLSCNKIIDSNGQEIDLISENDEDGEEENDDKKFVEVNLGVDNDSEADEIFIALSECASLHPCDEEENDLYSDLENDANTDNDNDIDQDQNSSLNKKNKIDLERFEDAAEN